MYQRRAGGDAEVWDALTAQRTFAFGRGQLAGANALGVIALSPDGAWLATQSAGSLAVEDVGLAGVPDRTAVLIRRARERVRRAVVPSLSAQVGVEDPRQ